MCLKKVNSTYKKNDKCEVWYKVAMRRELYDRKRFRSMYQVYYFNLGDAQHDRGRGKIASAGHYKKGKSPWQGKWVSGKKYEKGFHFYDLEGAKAARMGCFEYVILECIVWDIRTRGVDRFGKAVVAKNFRPMRIVK